MPIVTSSPASHPWHRQRLSVAILCLAIVLAIAAVLAFHFRGGLRPVAAADATDNDPASSKTAIVQPSGPLPKPHVQIDASPAPVVQPDVAEPATSSFPDYVPDGYVAKPGQIQLPDGKILTFPPPKPGETRKLAAYGHVYECYADGGWKDATPRKLFGTAFEENFLALSVEGRTFIPAFLTGLDQDAVVATLKKPYEPKGDESDEERAQLAAYDEMRAAALGYIEGGGTFDEFVTEIATFVKQERTLRAKGLREVTQLFRAGNIHDAKLRLEAINAALSTQGFAPLRIPGKMQDAFDAISEQHSN